MDDPGYSTEGFGRRTVMVGGIESVIYEIGEGPPVVYFHGGGTFHGFEWARDWAAHFRVILPHHPNFGESGDADFASLEDYAAHYVGIFAALGLGRFHLVGASMGGRLAATYAANAPGSVDRLVLVSPAGLSSPKASMPDFPAIPPAEIPALFVADPAFIMPFWPADPGPAWRALRAREDMAAFRARGDEGETDTRLRALMRAYRGPTLLLWGEDDQILPLPMIEEWQAVLPQAETVVIPGGGHLLLDESVPAREAALDFLKR